MLGLFSQSRIKSVIELIVLLIGRGHCRTTHPVHEKVNRTSQRNMNKESNNHTNNKGISGLITEIHTFT